MQNLNKFLNPGSIAVIGASNNKNKVGYWILENIINSGFPGNVYPINPKRGEILNLSIVNKIADLPEPVDLGVISIPAKHVLGMLQECGEANIKNLIIISAGFKEIGGKGADLERQLIKISNLTQEYFVEIIILIFKHQ